MHFIKFFHYKPHAVDAFLRLQSKLDLPKYFTLKGYFPIDWDITFPDYHSKVVKYTIVYTVHTLFDSYDYMRRYLRVYY